MNNLTYPYIGRSGNDENGAVVVFFGIKSGYLTEGSGYNSTPHYCDGWLEDQFENITREYLTNTYGKCESQEHADFICKLAESHGIELAGNKGCSYKYYSNSDFFNFFISDGRLVLGFFDSEAASDSGEKLIHLPLPPKENEMESQLPTASSGTEMPETKPTKPIYTKEMHERGELPPVGSLVETCMVKKVSERDFRPSTDCVIDLWGSGCVCEVVCHTEIGGQMLPVIKHKHQVSAVLITLIKPIPTIEDELIQFLEVTSHLSQKSRVDKMLEFYNITKK